MATKNIVPRANNEGGIGTSAKRWANGYFTDINASGDLSVTGTITGDLTGNVTGDVTGDLTGNVTGNVTGDVTGDLTGDVTGDVTGNVTGNADTATSATNDGLGNNIATTYLPAVVGAVIAFAGSTSPTGWLLCDGSAVSRITYADLYAVIGDTYGSGDGSTTFNLPNLIDKFVQGNATSGTEHSAGLPNITGSAWSTSNSAGGLYLDNHRGAITKPSSSAVASYPAFGNINTDTNCVIAFDASLGEVHNNTYSNLVYGKSDTVQPPSVTMRYIIKY